MANCIRMVLHSLANNLLVLLRQTIADLSPQKTSCDYLDQDNVPAEVVSVVATSTAVAKWIRWVKAVLVPGGCD